MSSRYRRRVISAVIKAMVARLLILWLLLLPAWAPALARKAEPRQEKPAALQPKASAQEKPVEWDEEKVLSFILAYNPLIQAQQTITREYTPSDNTLQQLLE